MTTNYHSEETLESIQTWAHETFGQPTVKRCYQRADEEFDELWDAVYAGELEEAVVEAADVVITLLNMPGILEAIDKKMKINRARKWNTTGDGTGYHVKETDVPT